MTNLNFAFRITQRQDEILNFISKENPNFIFNFLNNQEFVGKMFVGTRAQNSGAHCRVVFPVPQSKNSNFLDYSNQKKYYITFNVLENKKEGCLAFSLRKDLLDFWAENNTKDLYILAISNLDNKIYEIPVKSYLMGKYADFIHKKLTDESVFISNPLSKYQDVIFSIENNFIKSEKMNSEPYKGTYNTSYFNPQYIADFNYAKYRCKTSINVHIYDNSGNFQFTKNFRSIKELYDALVNEKKYEKSYKSLQRDVCSEKLISLGKGYFYATTDLSAPAEKLEVERVIDETEKNIFYDPELPEALDNMPENIVKDHYEVSKNNPKQEKEVTIEKIEKTAEFDFYNDDIENYLKESEQPEEIIEEEIFKVNNELESIEKAEEKLKPSRKIVFSDGFGPKSGKNLF